MKKGICLKCGGNNVYSNEKLTSRGERSVMAGDDTGKMSRRLFIAVVACTDCGYFEEYIRTQDLTDSKKMDYLKASWIKLGN